MRFFAASALALAFIATPALAQDGDSSFGGFHIEAVGGVDDASGGGTNNTGLTYGIGAGYDGDLGGAVIGVEVEGALSTVEWCPTGGVCVDAGRDLYAGVRAGKRIGDSGLIYLKGGYTNARVNITTGATTVFSDNLDGVRLGVGAEGHKGKLLFRVEYRYSNYEQDFSRHQLVLGVGITF